MANTSETEGLKIAVSEEQTSSEGNLNVKRGKKRKRSCQADINIAAEKTDLTEITLQSPNRDEELFEITEQTKVTQRTDLARKSSDSINNDELLSDTMNVEAEITEQTKVTQRTDVARKSSDSINNDELLSDTMNVEAEITEQTKVTQRTDVARKSSDSISNDELLSDTMNVEAEITEQTKVTQRTDLARKSSDSISNDELLSDTMNVEAEITEQTKVIPKTDLARQISDSINNDELLSDTMNVEAEITEQTKVIPKTDLARQISDSINNDEQLSDTMNVEAEITEQTKVTQRTDLARKSSDSISNDELLSDTMNVEAEITEQTKVIPKTDLARQISDSINNDEQLSDTMNVAAEISQQTKTAEIIYSREKNSDSTNSNEQLSEQTKASQRTDQKRKISERINDDQLLSDAINDATDVPKEGKVTELKRKKSDAISTDEQVSDDMNVEIRKAVDTKVVTERFDLTQLNLESINNDGEQDTDIMDVAEDDVFTNVSQSADSTEENLGSVSLADCRSLEADRELSEDKMEVGDTNELEIMEKEGSDKVTDTCVSLTTIDDGNADNDESLRITKDADVHTDKTIPESTDVAGDTPTASGAPRRNPTKRAGNIKSDGTKSSRKKIRLPEEILKLLPKHGIFKYTEEAHAKLKDIISVEKSLKCPKNGCGKSYKKLISFKYHAARCGVKISIKCDVCGKTYTTPEGLKYHMKATHRVKENTDEQDENSTEKSNEVVNREPFVSRYGRRRKVFKTGTEDSKSSAEEDSDDANKEVPQNKIQVKGRSKKWIEYMETLPEPEKSSTAETSEEAWKEQLNEVKEKLKRKEIVLCPKNCGRSIKSLDRLKKHLNSCPGGDRALHRCKLCPMTFISMPGIKYHIISKHRKPQVESDYEAELECLEVQKPKVRKLRKPRVRINRKVNYEETTKAWCEVFHCQLVFSDWKPTLRHWSKVPLSDVQDYLPVREMSPRFEIQFNKDSETIEDTEEYPEFQLPIFSSIPINTESNLCNLTFNVGGSVWAMDWVPIPVNESKRDQYLAIGCHRDPEKLHLVTESYQDKGILQIWRVPMLENKKRPKKQAEFCLGIAHDYGPLWDICWCPSGAWEKDDETSKHLRRLGLLALACADGKVRILSVPFPDSLLENPGGKDATKPHNLIFCAIPHAVLSPGSICRLYRGECGSVWSVAWLPLEPHKKIIAAYCDGTVAVWDLTTQNSLLRLKLSNGLSETLFPISHFQAHRSAIRALAWCPSDPNYIATGGYDRYTNIWDLRHTSQPVTFLKRGYNYQFTWPIHYGALIYSCDNAINHGSCCTRAVDLYNKDTTRNELPTFTLMCDNSAAWDNDYCNWSNLLASVDASGEVQMNILTNLHRKRNMKRRDVMPIYRVTYEELDQSHVADKEQINPDPSQNQATSNENSENGISLKSSETRDTYKLVFKDTHPLFATEDEQERLRKHTKHAAPDKQPYSALHKICWNPNITSYEWLASGGRAGIVRICYTNEMA